MVLVFEEVDDTCCSCLASGIGGIIVPEQLTIVEICQDEDNLGIVYVTVNIQGIYSYDVVANVVYLDGSTTKTIDITDRFISSYKGIGVDGFPILTNCGAVTVVLAYDIGSMIPSFDSLASFKFNITFNGLPYLGQSELIQSTNIFVSTNPTASITFNKGVSPKPYKIFFNEDNNQLKIQYTNLGTTPCLCAINCITPQEEDFGLTICNNEIQEIVISNNSVVGDPTNIPITFLDPIGNITSLNIHAVNNVIPKSLEVFQVDNPNRLEVYLFYVTVNNTLLDISKLEYQIWKYKNNIDNAYIWKDWSKVSWATFYDTDIETFSTYGYAVRFRGEFGELSKFSVWAEKYIESN